jgi:hypothetical protein
MKRLLLLALLLAGCGGGKEEAAKPQPKQKAKAAAPAAPAPIPPTSDVRPAIDAAATLKRYYGFIEKGDYDAAWALRSGPATEAERKRFAANFRAYERYRATVNVPGEPVEADGWEYVEVPVMIYGSYRGGRPFGSTGSVSLRRAVSVPDASPRERAWRIYTGDR